MSEKKHSHRRRRRSDIFIYKTITASLPFIEVDLKLTPAQVCMFINGLKYVIPNQSRLCTRSPLKETLTKQYERLSATVKECLKDNRIRATDAHAQQAFSTLERLFYEFQSKRISKTLTSRALREYQVVRSLQHLLRQRPDIVVRRTDKSKVF